MANQAASIPMGKVIGGPQATSTPNSDILTYDSDAMKGEKELTLAELLMILDPSLELLTQDLSGTPERHWTERTLSIRACYEVLYGIVTERIPYYLVASLLEVLCYYLENTFLSADLRRIEDCRTVFRSYLAILHLLLVEPSSGPWVAKLLSIFYQKEGILPTEKVNNLLQTLNVSSKNSRTKTLYLAVLALLHDIQPLRPDLIKDSLFRNGIGSFLKYGPEFSKSTNQPLNDTLMSKTMSIKESITQSNVQSNVQTSKSQKLEIFEKLTVPKTYFGWNRTPLNVHRTDRWFTADSLKDPRLFVKFWTKIRFPDHVSSLFGDDRLLNVYWLAPKPSSTASALEKRVLNQFDFAYGRGLAGNPNSPVLRTATEEKNRRMFQLSTHISDYLHEMLPSAATSAVQHIMNTSTPFALFCEAVKNLSVIFLAGNSLNYLIEVLRRIKIRFQSENFKLKLEILEAFHKMLEDFCRDLPRLWLLEVKKSEADRRLMAKTQFVHDETAIQACYVDTSATLGVLLEYVDAILWEPLLLRPEKQLSLQMWSQALDIWQLMSNVDMLKEAFSPPTVLVPHPQFFLVGLLHPCELIVSEMESLAKRYVELDDLCSQPTERVEVLRSILRIHN